MAEIQIVAKETHQPLANISGTSAKLKEPSIVLLKVSPQDISTLKREGTSVIAYLKNGEVIKIENFFSETEVTDNSLVLGAGTDQLIWARFTSDDGILLNIVQYQSLENIDELLYSDESSNLLYWVGVPLAVGAVALAVDDKDSSTSDEDTTKPKKVTDTKVSDDGSTVTGKAEAGSKVIIRDSKGKVIGSGQVNDQGDFEVKLDPPLTNGESIKVGVKDPAGNASDDEIVKAPDTTPPTEPTKIKISNDGKTITGKAEVGSTVSIKDQDGKEIAKGVVDEYGDFKIELDPALASSENIKVSVKDPAGNESKDVAAKVPPAQPKVYFDGTELHGTTEPSATIEIRHNGELIGTVLADKNGQYRISLYDPLSNGEKIDVIAIDKFGNKSEISSIFAPDTTAPDMPEVDTFDGAVISGTAEVGSTVKVKTAQGEEQSVVVGSDGQYKIVLKTPLQIGDIVEVTATDQNKNTSLVKEVEAAEPVVPEQPPVQPEEPATDTEQVSTQLLGMNGDPSNSNLLLQHDLAQLLNIADEIMDAPSTVNAEQDSVDLAALFKNTENTAELDEFLQSLPVSTVSKSETVADRSYDPMIKSESLMAQEFVNPLQDLLQQQELQF